MMRYVCCSRCNEERKKTKESMRSYERLSVSMSADKTELLIWCNRHDCAVARIGVGGVLSVIPPGLTGEKAFLEISAVERIDEEIGQIGARA